MKALKGNIGTRMDQKSSKGSVLSPAEGCPGSAAGAKSSKRAAGAGPSRTSAHLSCLKKLYANLWFNPEEHDIFQHSIANIAMI